MRFAQSPRDVQLDDCQCPRIGHSSGLHHRRLCRMVRPRMDLGLLPSRPHDRYDFYARNSHLVASTWAGRGVP